MSTEDVDLEGVAIVGLAGRFPGARTVAELWANLTGGVESISFFTDEEVIAAGADAEQARAPNYVKARGILGDPEMFDAAFFGVSPREAALMDPQHRVFLECAWEALESAGYSPDRQPGRVGVFAGMSMNTYLLSNIYEQIDHVASVETLAASIGNDKDSLTTEVAYRLNLRGPAVTVQSSSSTSLTAIHHACQSLLNFECDMALGGGVSIHFPEKAGYLYYEGGTTAPDGHCRAFDAEAKGFVAGHGAGVVVLRRLADAVAAGDTIYAVVKGSAVNNDGSAKVSYMAPSVEGQAEVIALAQAVAGVTPESIGYVEGHGTATPMGDPIEVAALKQAFGDARREGGIALGSIKTNIGHLDAAAGVAGFIKAALVLHHKRIPPTLHYQRPNPALGIEDSPFHVVTKLTEWPAGDTPRRAGVTSLGMGGTNAHAVLEEAPPIEAGAEAQRPAQLVVLSARTETALEAMTDRLAAHLEAQPDLALADVAYTLQAGRRHFGARRAFIARGIEDAKAALATRDASRILGGNAGSAGRPVVFMFSGQGAQHVDMGRGLYETEPAFRAEVDACAKLLQDPLGLDLRTILYPPAHQREDAAARLRDTALAQPALFVIEYALAKLWMSWGVTPRAMIGHSIGEYVAAAISGVLALPDALSLVAARGRLMSRMAPGAMLGVSLSEDEVKPLLGADLSIAAINGARITVVAGPAAAVDALAASLDARGVKATRLHTSHAFHSSMMEPMLDAFRREVAKVPRRAPSIPYASNLTGGWIEAADLERPDAWAAHLRRPVRFADGLGLLLRDPDAVLIEVGPGQTLVSLAQQHPDFGRDHLAIASMRPARGTDPDGEVLLRAVARLWIAGVDPDWAALHGGQRRRRVPLPTYPFERRRHWVEPRARAARAEGPPAGSRRPISEWLYLPAWRRTPALPAALPAPGTRAWILTPDPAASSGIGAALAGRLRDAGHEVVLLGAAEADDLREVADRLIAEGRAPEHVFHLWSTASAAEVSDFDRAQSLGSMSLLALAQALTAGGAERPCSITVVTHRAAAIGDELPRPEAAMVIGASRVIGEEHPSIRCRIVDVSLPRAGSWEEGAIADRILAEHAAAGADPVALIRGRERWVRAYDPLPAPDADPKVRDQGVYLILGGFGTLGYAHAEALARRSKARLVLAGRTALPDPSTWDAYLASHDAGDAVSRRIRKAQALSALGAEVISVSADVEDAAQIRAAIHASEERFGALHGVVFAAGTVDAALFSLIAESTPALCYAQFGARVRGLVALDEALGDRALDFVVLDGSLAAALGGLGRFAYAASASFVSAFAARRSRTSASPWLAIGWDAWVMDEDAAIRDTNPFAATAVKHDEGALVFLRALGLLGEAEVLVSTTPLAARLTKPAAKDEAPADGARDAEEAAPRAPRGSLQNAYVAPRDDLESHIAAVWSETLGIEAVGVHDNFFELGGNSLVGVKMIDRLREELGVPIAAVSLYERPTVDAMAGLVRAARSGAGDDEDREGQDRGERRRGQQRRRRRADGEG